MTDQQDLELLKYAISVSNTVISQLNTVISQLMDLPLVEGVYIAVQMSSHLCDINTRAGHIKDCYNIDKLREIAEEAYCSSCCCAEKPLSESCAECSLYEFLEIIDEISKELDPPKEEEEEE